MGREMLAWLLLIPALLTFAVGAWLSYDDECRNSKYYPWLFTFLGVTCSTLWIIATRALGDKDKIFVYSLFWDSLMMACYYLLPLVAMGVRVNTGILVGTGLVVAGLVVVKVASPS